MSADTDTDSSVSALLCPSAQPQMDDAVAIGVIDRSGASPEVAYLEHPVSVTNELLEMTQPLKPTEVLRFAAPCQKSACSHWDGSCKLVTRIVQLIPAASLSLPRCHVRTECRWFAQEGRHACRRCPNIVTQDESPSDAMRVAAIPK